MKKRYTKVEREIINELKGLNESLRLEAKAVSTDNREGKELQDGAIDKKSEAGVDEAKHN